MISISRVISSTLLMFDFSSDGLLDGRRSSTGCGVAFAGATKLLRPSFCRSCRFANRTTRSLPRKPSVIVLAPSVTVMRPSLLIAMLRSVG